MTRRERLMATLDGKPVDRPPVNFYEINGWRENPADENPLNVYSDPSWQPLLTLAREHTDRVVMCSVPFRDAPPDPMTERRSSESWTDADGSRFTRTTIQADSRTFTSLTRRDPDMNTTWTLEHFLKDADDVKAWLELPEPTFGGEPDVSGVLRIEEEIGDTGIVMINSADPICAAAPLFDMGDYLVVAMTEPELFHALLERTASAMQYRTDAIARALPGRLWRICGPEYASEPYLPPRLFEEYVIRYDTPLVDAIQRYGGYARIHSHGRLLNILDMIASTGCMGLDPIEPPPQGDVELSYVREKHGEQLVLFGNLEMSEIGTLPTPQFRERVKRAIEEGTAGAGRGFLLQPSACPCSRHVSPLILANYEAMVDIVERW